MVMAICNKLLFVTYRMPMLALNTKCTIWKYTMSWFSSFLWWLGLWSEELCWTRLVKKNGTCDEIRTCAEKVLYAGRQDIWASWCGIALSWAKTSAQQNCDESRTWSRAFSQCGNVVGCICDEHKLPEAQHMPNRSRESSCDNKLVMKS